ncbi:MULTISPECIES: ATP-binding protein [Cyanophyceae]|uniref:ATP-dependent nuclease n=1 Tax=Cyanophyceae TaxID=3028117 RepID=UPI0016860467|nr:MULTISPECIES: ATP-binding protein [Cyanophyceae]MBD1914845.1 AAA family ATPase [Phormidium sp. FACHB-77]MBD2029963.1 AAA family ATPase [Phormidium sp. FACHB-322]MBD2049273.1 AAA family ATPase [Leptolyngbya sp. FACHB-60]
MEISEIKVSIKNYRCFSDLQPAAFRIKAGFTSFVGPNNSGKTSLLKFFYEVRALFKLLSSKEICFYKSSQESPTFFYELSTPVGQNLEKDKMLRLNKNIFCTKNNRSLKIKFEVLFTEDKTSIKTIVEIDIPREKDNFFTISVLDLDSSKYIDPNERIEINFSLKDAFRLLSDTSYFGSFRNALSVESVYLEGIESQISANQKYFDIRFGHDFYTLWSELKYGNSKENHILTYQITEAIKSIFNFSSLEINSSNTAYTLLLTVNGESYMLDEMGAGLSQILLVLVNAAVSKPSFILIDEPELNLHPSLQLDFLTSLASFAKRGIIFSTHSLGLARSSSERIYSVFKNASNETTLTEFEATNSLPELLGELNFSSYQNFKFSKILLVEGVTEIKTIQQFLRKWKKDKEFVLIPLGGSQLIRNSIEFEMTELKRISEKLFALVDSERNHEDCELDKNRSQFLWSCKSIGIECHILKRRATENYFSDRAVKAVKGEKYRALEPYEKLNTLQFSWSKSENWRIAREMEQAEVIDTDLGEFLSHI